jgi:hypothetical protein
MEIVNEVWLFTREGNPIAEFCQDTCIDESLVPNFVSELKTYISLLTNVLQSFDFENFKITFSPALDENIYIVCISPFSVKNKKIIRVCKEFVKLFEGLYKVSDIIKWDGDLNFFDKFKQRINLYLQMSDF